MVLNQNHPSDAKFRFYDIAKENPAVCSIVGPEKVCANRKRRLGSAAVIN
jgi:hypothetical protein